MYSVSSFRTNIRQAFEDAAAGQEVVIERYGTTFRLIRGDVAAQPFMARKLTNADLSGLKVEPGMGYDLPVLEPHQIVEDVNGEVSKGLDTTRIVAQTTPVTQPQITQKYCPNGHPYPLGRERCMGKGCKYS